MIQKSTIANSLVIKILAMLCLVSIVTLYSANISFFPYAVKQLIWFVIGLTVMWGVSYIQPYVFYCFAYPLYVVTFVLLVAVFLFGSIGMGARRWIDLYFFKMQPSELLRVAIIITLQDFVVITVVK